MLFRRESGILLHPTSLPGPYGIGEIGSESMRWLETLHAMGQRLWQVLPLGPTGFGDSPYQNLSTFAAGWLLLDLESLGARGLLDRAELESARLGEGSVDFGEAIATREPLLHGAARRFVRHASGAERVAFDDFCRRHAAWLDDWALFAALKHAEAGRPWVYWPSPLRDRDGEAISRAAEDLRDAIEEARALQFLFAEQWELVRRRASALGVRLIGDIPIFVAHDSADVWQHRDLFQLDAEGKTAVVAGVPPDYFSRTGQRWGNPLYRWEAHAAEDYTWWTGRVRRVLDFVDVVRIDHFRGFAAYWEIPANEPTAVKGRWVEGPGAELFQVLRRELRELPIIAEDLGLITDDVAELRDGLGLPGMRVFQFAFGADGHNSHLPDAYVENCVAYTGTHDNDTLVGWLEHLRGSAHATAAPNLTRDSLAAEQARLLRYLRRKKHRVPENVAGACIDIVLRSRAGATVFPLQDVLGLGSEARMNTPGRAHGNWTWRFAWEQLTPRIRERFARRTTDAGR